MQFFRKLIVISNFVISAKVYEISVVSYSLGNKPHILDTI